MWQFVYSNASLVDNSSIRPFRHSRRRETSVASCKQSNAVPRSA
jgi:hypothetical protein